METKLLLETTREDGQNILKHYLIVSENKEDSEDLPVSELRKGINLER